MIAKPNQKRFLFSADPISSIKDWCTILKRIVEARNLTEIIAYSRLKGFKKVKERLNSAEKMKKLRNRSGTPLLYTNFVMRNLVESLSTWARNSGEMITSLTLDRIPLRNKKYFNPLIDGLKSARNLTVLSLARCRIGDSGCNSLLNSVAEILTLGILNLTSCSLTNRSSLSISVFLKRRKASFLLNTWNDSFVEISSTEPQGLHTLVLNHNRKFTDCGVRELVEILKEDFWLKTLNLRHCGLTQRAGEALLEILETNSILRTIDLKENDIPESILYKISKILKSRKKIGEGFLLRRKIVRGKNGFRKEGDQKSRKKSLKKMKSTTNWKKFTMMDKGRDESNVVKLSNRLSKVIFSNEELLRGIIKRRKIISKIKTQRLEMEKAFSRLEPRVYDLKNEICNRDELLARISQESELVSCMKSAFQRLADPEIEGSLENKSPQMMQIDLKNKKPRSRRHCLRKKL